MQPVEAFQKVLSGQMSVADFEAWVYASPDLVAFLEPDEYLELISLSYKTKGALQELEKLINRHVDWGKVRTQEVQLLLLTVIEKQNADDVLEALITSYNLYCHDYDFLQVLATNFGLTAKIDFNWDMTDGWLLLAEKRKWRYLNQFYPMVQEEASRVLGWLTAGRIQLYEQPDGEIGCTDHRSPVEQQATCSYSSPVRWYVPKLPTSVAASLSTTSVPNPIAEARKWWQFWK